MSIAEPAATAAAKPSNAKAEPKKTDEKRDKRTITEIRESKKTAKKMVYMSVPDYTSAQWAEMAGVGVAVLGDSLAMIAHGHRSTIPATMDMMIMHGQAVRRGAPNTFMLGCMPYQSYHTVDRALANASRFMQETLCDAVSRRAVSRRRTYSRRWSMPAFQRRRTSVSRRIRLQCSVASRSRAALRTPQ